jgi:hypothetical protein
MNNETLDDSRLLDIIIENRVEETSETLDTETRARLEDIQTLHGYLMETKAEKDRNQTGLSEAQMEAVLDRVTKERSINSGGGVLRYLQRTPLSWAAAILFLVVVGWMLVGPGTGHKKVYAAVFGGIEIFRDGAILTPVSHEVKIQAGDVLVSTSGGIIDIDHGILLKVGSDTRLACMQLALPEITLDLEAGLLRYEPQPSRAYLTLTLPSAKVIARDSVFTLQFLGRGDDQIVVDRGEVEIHPDKGKIDRVTPKTGAFSLARFSSFRGKIDLEPCCKHKKCGAKGRGHLKRLPVQNDPKKALEMARAENYPVLISREDGPCLSTCFKCCCCVNFHAKQRGLCGIVWLILDPAKHKDTLERYNLDKDPSSLVILDSSGTVIDRGKVQKTGKPFETLLNFINAGKKACRK